MIKISELLTVCGHPAFVKQASELPYTDSYGIESREDVYLGFITALGSGSSTSRYTKIAAFWGIDNEIKQAQVRWDKSNEEQPLQDTDYLLVQDFKGTPIKKFAAFDLHSTIKAANAFFENRWRYPYAWRKCAAERCLNKIAQYNVQLSGGVDRYIKKAAGLAMPSQESLENAITERYSACKNSSGFTKLAELLHTIAVTDELRQNPEVVKIAMQAMDVFDADLPEQKRAAVKTAEEVCDILDEDMIKVAQDMISDHVQLINGCVVKVADLHKDALEAVSPGLEKMSSDELRDILPTLPKPDADLLVRLQRG